jgi:hypothetical protein
MLWGGRGPIWGAAVGRPYHSRSYSALEGCSLGVSLLGVYDIDGIDYFFCGVGYGGLGGCLGYAIHPYFAEERGGRIVGADCSGGLVFFF